MTDLPPAGGVDPAAFLSQLIQQDVSGRAALSQLRDAGMTMGNQAFYSLYGQIRDAVGGRSELQALDYAALPTGADYSTYAAGPGGQYATFVQTYVRPVGGTTVEPRYFIHVTDTPHTPNEAIAMAQQQLIEGEAANPAYGGQVTIGTAVTSVTQTVARTG